MIVVYVYYNTEIELYTIMLTVGVLILEHPRSVMVLKLFWLTKSKTESPFVSIMRLVTGFSEGEERLQLRNAWSM